jgi:tetratricopeptide (TPR) repeat protein
LKNYNKKQGLRYYRKKQYKHAIAALEKALREKKGDPELHLFLGYSSLFTGDLEGARHYFKSGLLANENNTDLMKGLAFVYLKDERIEDAISLWGEVLRADPNDRKVKKNLVRLREAEGVERFAEAARPADFLSTGPPLYVKLQPYIIALSIICGVIIASTLFYTTPLYQRALEKFYPEIVRLNQVRFPNGAPITSEDGEALYSYTGKEITASFARIKRYIYKNRVNAAIIELNRIMLSNASPEVKERFEILYKFIRTPDPLTLDYDPRFYEIMKEPAAYHGVFVLWTGKIANLKRDKQGAEFDMLVSYEDQDTLEGVAHVEIRGTFYIENRQNIELFGTFSGYDKKTGKMDILGILLRDLGM